MIGSLAVRRSVQDLGFAPYSLKLGRGTPLLLRASLGAGRSSTAPLRHSHRFRISARPSTGVNIHIAYLTIDKAESDTRSLGSSFVK
jgi:hypothetical protein